MDWNILLIIAGMILVLFFLSGMPVAVGFLGAAMVLLACFVGGADALVLAATGAYTSIMKFTLVPIPLFILMGEVLYHSGLISVIIDVVDKWIGGLRARLCLVGIGSGTILSAMTGVAMGDLAVLGTTLLPEMTQRGYDKKLSMGSLMAGSSIAAIIPPSLLAVLVGTVGNISVAALLMAGVVPGLVLAFAYGAYVIGRTRVNPELAPVYPSKSVTMKEKMRGILRTAPFLFIIFSVLGLIAMGVATPTEASAMGVIACYIVAAIYRRLTFKVIKESLIATIRVSGMVMLILLGATVFSQVLAATGATRGLSQWVVSLGLHPLLMLFIIQLMIFILCMFMDQMALMMITLPIFMPVVVALGIDPLMFGVVYLINIVTGGKTPPFGYLLFVMKGVYPEANMTDIYRSVIPFVIIDILVMVLIVAFPAVAVWFPSLVIK